MVSDKWAVRDYVARNGALKYLIPLLWHGDRPEQIPFDELPAQFVIKANHGSGYNILVTDKATLDRNATVAQLTKWMAENFGDAMGLGIAWGYRNITPHVIVEAFLGDGIHVPVDFKFFCFSGRVEFFKVDLDRFSDHSTQYFTRDAERLDLVEVGFKSYEGNVDMPENLNEMMTLAEALSGCFDFIRVDLYNVGGKIYFGELTAYPGGVSNRLDPNAYDVLFGDKWKSVAWLSARS